jgi:hypothetical protein
MDVYLLWHAYVPDEEKEVKLLGVYSSEAKAQEAKATASSLSGFRDHPDGFEISSYTVDRACWTEGFVTVR